jgi:sporulation protein YlmC with PRC-barrel domain
MRKFYTAGAAAALAFGMAMPAFAQSSMTHTTATTPPAASSTGTMTAAPGRDTTTAGNRGPSGTLHKVHGQWRASSLVGATVYNNTGHEIGTVENLLIRSQGTVSGAVLSVGGFLGVGTKYVEVPFSRLHFKESAGTGNNGKASRVDYSLVLPGATQASLKKMPAFKYHAHS